MKALGALLGCVAAWEVSWWALRRHKRAIVYRCALDHARAEGRPLVVVGAPDCGPTVGPGCGDLAIDIAPTSCPHAIQCDITRPIPLPDDSCVAFVSCVLEYVDDYDAALAELLRISGGRLYVVRVEPWTLVGWAYPGRRRCLPPHVAA